MANQATVPRVGQGEQVGLRVLAAGVDEEVLDPAPLPSHLEVMWRSPLLTQHHLVTLDTVVEMVRMGEMGQEEETAGKGRGLNVVD